MILFINPLFCAMSYVRYKATGTMRLTENGQTTERSGAWIYEFANMTSSYREQMSGKK